MEHKCNCIRVNTKSSYYFYSCVNSTDRISLLTKTYTKNVISLIIREMFYLFEGSVTKSERIILAYKLIASLAKNGGMGRCTDCQVISVPLK